MSLPGILVYLTGIPVTSFALDYAMSGHVSRNNGKPFRQEDIVTVAVLWPVAIPYMCLSTLAITPLKVREYMNNKP